MPISIKELERIEELEKPWIVVYDTVRQVTLTILRKEGHNTEVEIRNSNMAYQKEFVNGDRVVRFGKSRIKYWYRKKPVDLYWVEDGKMYEIEGAHKVLGLEGKEVMAAVIIEECAHDFQPLDSRTHGDEFKREFVRLWEKYFDWLVEMLPDYAKITKEEENA